MDRRALGRHAASPALAAAGGGGGRPAPVPHHQNRTYRAPLGSCSRVRGVAGSARALFGPVVTSGAAQARARGCAAAHHFCWASRQHCTASAPAAASRANGAPAYMPIYRASGSEQMTRTICENSERLCRLRSGAWRSPSWQHALPLAVVLPATFASASCSAAHDLGCNALAPIHCHNHWSSRAGRHAIWCPSAERADTDLPSQRP